MVIIPKFHKNPLTFRTVTIGCNTYNNVASQKLFIILNHIYENNKNHPKNVSVNNSYDLKNKLIKLKDVKSINCFDFKDLFNNIPIQQLQSVILELYRNTPVCTVNNEIITHDYLTTLTNYVIKNNYIKYNDNIYLQIMGIPQGGKNSSILADLFLSYFESNQSYNNNNYIFRYIDDILIVNLCDGLSFPIKYPVELELLKSNKNNTHANFLDLSLYINKNNLLEINLFNKRDEFKFNVNSLTYFHSCVHKSVFKNIITNHLNRIKKLTTKKYTNKNLNNFLSKSKSYSYPSLYIKNILQGFSL